MALICPSAMDKKLFAVLSQNEINQDIISHLAGETLEVFTIAHFANVVDPELPNTSAGQQLQRKILDATRYKDHNGQYSRLKQAWKEAEAANDRALKRQSEGFPEVDLDDPLAGR